MGRDRLTYADVAQRAGVGKATVTRFLNGDARSPRHWPDRARVEALSRGVGFDLDAALEEEVARCLVEKIGDAGPARDTLMVDFGPGAFEGLSRQEVLEVGSAAELAGLARLAEVRGRRRELARTA